MEWTKDKVSSAVSSVTPTGGGDSEEGRDTQREESQGKSKGGSSESGLSGYATRAYKGLTGAAGDAYDGAGGWAEDAYNDAGDYVEDTYEKGLGDITSSFQPDPNLIWEGYLIYGVLAAGSTTFWWATVTAADYLQSVYPGSHIIRYLVFAYFGPWLISYIVVSVFWRNATSWIKILVGLGLSLYAIFRMTYLAGLLIGNEGTTTTFWLMLVEVAIAGCGDSITRGCIFGVASELPDGFMKASVGGAVGSGLFAFIIRVITKASLSSSQKGLAIGAVIHFCLCSLVIIAAMALFIYIHTMPSMSYYDSLNLGSSDTIRLIIQNENSVSLEVASGAAIATIATGRPSPPPPLEWLTMLGKIQLHLIAVGVTAVISFSIFPAYLTQDVHSSSLGSWYPVLLVGTYVIFDILGGFTSYFAGKPKQPTVLALSLARLLLVVAFVLLLLYGPGHTSSMILIFLFTAILAYTNGFLVVLASFLVPKSVKLSEAETSTIASGVILYTGALIGVGLSWSFLPAI